MMRVLVAFFAFLSRLIIATIRIGNLIALILAAFLYVQIQMNILTMETQVQESLNEISCTAKMQDHISHAQAYATDCADIASMEVYRAFTLDEELTQWSKDCKAMEKNYKKEVVINRSMRVYIGHLHALLRKNEIRIPFKHTRPIGGEYGTTRVSAIGENL